MFRARTELGIESAAALEQVKVRASEYKRGVSKPGSTPRTGGFLLSKAVGSVVSGARFTYERFSVSMKLVLQTFPICYSVVLICRSTGHTGHAIHTPGKAHPSGG